MRLKRRLKASWCATRAFSARSNRSRSSGVSRARSRAWFQCRRCAMGISKKRCWNGVRAISPRLGRGTSRRSCSMAVATRASSRSVCCRNRSRGPSCRPACRARLATWMAMMESPPSSKKLSSAPISSSPSTSLQMLARACSTGPSGATKPRLFCTGCGKALRSSLPLALRGIFASVMICAGTM
ncbi:hypothetical protein D3C85_710220 [compost metagenome]